METRNKHRRHSIRRKGNTRSRRSSRANIRNTPRRSRPASRRKVSIHRVSTRKARMDKVGPHSIRVILRSSTLRPRRFRRDN